MTCPNCKRETVALFLTVACDWCDFGPPDVSKLYVGYIAYSGTEAVTYVFMSRDDAGLWADTYAKEPPVRRVYSLQPFPWFTSHYIVAGACMADGEYEVFPDHRYEPLSRRVFLAPEGG